MGATVTDAAALGGIRCCSVCRAIYHSDFQRCPNDGGTLEMVETDPLIGRTVATYEIDAHIGSGAMGRVYRCHHAHLQHRQLALKVLHGDLAATPAMRMRFTQEAEAASQLGHPNVVSVIDFGRSDDGLLYLAMELVDGRCLGEIVADGPMEPTRVVRLARQMCAGLGHAHDRGLVHRDFKPDNILIAAEGGDELLRIVDFGLAISADPEANTARLTTAGSTVGTPVYAAPEQTQGASVDHRADLFALGVTMFEMLAGRQPFDGNTLEVMYLNAGTDRPTIASRSNGASVPPRLERLVLRLMAAAAEDRPSSTREVVSELDGIQLQLEHGATEAVSLPLGEPHRPTHTRAWAIAAAVVVGVIGVALWRVSRDRTDHADPPLATIDADQRPRERAPAAVRELTAPAATVPLAVQPTSPPRETEPAPAPIAKRASTSRPATRSNRVKPSAATHVEQAGSVGIVPGDETAPVGSGSTGTASPPIAEPPPPEPPPIAPVPVTPRPPPPPPPPAAKLVTRANVAIDAFTVRGSLTSAVVRRALARVTSAVQSCYGPAVTRAGASPALRVRVRFEIDESQRARAIQAAESSLPGLSACVARALDSVRAETAPDVGTVDVGLTFLFTPEGS